MADDMHVQDYLRGLSYPATKDDIIRHAREQGADDNVIRELQRLPQQDYTDPGSVTRALGGGNQ